MESPRPFLIRANYLPAFMQAGKQGATENPLIE